MIFGRLAAVAGICMALLTACSGGSSPPVDPDTGEPAPTVATFAKSYGDGGFNSASAAIATRDGGFAFVGHWRGEAVAGSTQESGHDLWISKLDAEGNLEWQRNLGERRLDQDAQSETVLTSPMRRTADGGYIVGGTERTRVTEGGIEDFRYRFRVVKTNAAGSVEWARSYGSGPWADAEYIGKSSTDLVLEADDTFIEDIWSAPGGGYWAVGRSYGSLRVPGTLGLLDFHDAYSSVVLHLNDAGEVIAQRRFGENPLSRGVEHEAIVRSNTLGQGVLLRRMGQRTFKLDILDAGASMETVDTLTRSLPEQKPDDQGSWQYREWELVAMPNLVDIIQTDDRDTDTGVRDGESDDGYFIVATAANLGGGGRFGFQWKVDRNLDIEWGDPLTRYDEVIETVMETCFSGAAGIECRYLLGGYAVGEFVYASPAPGVAGAVLHVVDPDDLAFNHSFESIVDLGRLALENSSFDAMGFDPSGLITVVAGQGATGRLLRFSSSGRSYIEGSSIDFSRVHANPVVRGTLQRRHRETRVASDGSFVISHLPSVSEPGQPWFAAGATYQAFSRAGVPLPLADLGAGSPRSEHAVGIVEVAEDEFLIAAQTTTTPNQTRLAWVVRVSHGVVGDPLTLSADQVSLSKVAAIVAGNDGGAVLSLEVLEENGSTSHRLVGVNNLGQAGWQSPALGTLAPAPGSDSLRAIPGGYLVLSEGRLIRVDEQGNPQWQRGFSTFDPSGVSDPGTIRSFDAVDSDADGARDDGFIVLLQGRSTGTGFMQSLRLGPDGESLWARNYGIDGGTLDARRVRQARDGSFIVGATTDAFMETQLDPVTGRSRTLPTGNRNITIFKLEADGLIRWQRLYGGLYDEVINDLNTLPDGGILVAGGSDSMGDNREAWILRLGADGMVSTGCNASLPSFVETPAAARQKFDQTQLFVTSEHLGSFAPSSPIAFLQRTINLASREESVVTARQCQGLARSDDPTPVDPAPTVRLTVVQAGTRVGVVTSTPLGIACGTGAGSSDCSADFAPGTQITLTADNTSLAFRRWNADCAPGTAANVCMLTLEADLTVAVVFGSAIDATFELAVTARGPGAVIGEGLSCRDASAGAGCLAEFPEGAEVQLDALPDTDSRFAGWAGENCVPPQQAPDASITVRLDRHRHCIAEFIPEERNGLITLAVAGGGVVRDGAGAFNCRPESSPDLCTEFYETAQQITLTATPDADQRFVGWGGDCSMFGNQNPIQLSTAQNATCTAQFAERPGHRLRVTLLTVSPVNRVFNRTPGQADGDEIDCTPVSDINSAECQEVYPEGTVVRLVPEGAFDRWENCEVQEFEADVLNCLVTMNGPRDVLAVFRN